VNTVALAQKPVTRIVPHYPPFAGATGGASPEEDPHYFDSLPSRPKQAAADQWAWIEAQLAASTAQFVFVGGHYSL
jgi:hypothetical protein